MSRYYMSHYILTHQHQHQHPHLCFFLFTTPLPIQVKHIQYLKETYLLHQHLSEQFKRRGQTTTEIALFRSPRSNTLLIAYPIKFSFSFFISCFLLLPWIQEPAAISVAASIAHNCRQCTHSNNNYCQIYHHHRQQLVELSKKYRKEYFAPFFFPKSFLFFIFFVSSFV